ncbi:MAG: hypothetical protein A2042_08290 [Candidatus Schekmanbacteria bacterium GWA2_38_11]|uniref:Uncharacterized protein n=1 Tax=Candidatus Schekmanbacteria bacterium GWA2_38_11 TaxID=1817876 RepID=A0A1F7RDX0_9BACT|nr:MAG: hypothetical protein A2042_08290 [Candidatus Schekmanbacteria bacterium GWA2_38_11]
MYFSKTGPENTEETLKIALREAESRGIRYLIVASTFGDTALKAANLVKGKDIKLIVVTHNTGFKKPGEQEFREDVKSEVEKTGGIVYTGTMVLRGIGRGIKNKINFSHEEIIANVLRMFCQGIKVCVEIAAMASDAGLIPFSDVIAVGGTARGADTACVIKADSSNNFFDIKIKEILVKPSEF